MGVSFGGFAGLGLVPVGVRLRRVFLLAGVVFAALPTSSALADTTVGATGSDQAFTCPQNFDYVTLTPSYTVPTNGVITSFSMETVPQNAGQQLDFQVLRPEGGTTYMVVGHTGSVTLAGTAGGIETFSANIAAQAGDLLGVFDVTGVANCLQSGGSAIASMLGSDPAVGTTVDLGQQSGAFFRNESATLTSGSFGPFATSTGLTCSPNPASTGQMVTCTASVSVPNASGAPDGGAVQFTDPGTTIPGCAAVPVDTTTGQATCTTTFTAPGSYQLQASYSGDADFKASQSAVITQTVNGPPPTATSLSLSSSASLIMIGKRVTYTAQVSPVPGGGHVSFYDDGHLIAGCTNLPVSTAGTATCSRTYSQPAAHTIRARYKGNAQFTNSTSDQLTERVRRHT